MKFSRYNSIINLNDNFSILYNAVSDKFMVLTVNAHQQLKTNTANTLRSYNPKLYEQMLEIGAIIDENTHELDAISHFIKERCEDDTTFQLHVNPTVDCNFRCWYCYENHLKGTKMDGETLDSIKLFSNQIFEQHLQLRNFNLSFFGGEPLMYFDHIARPLIEYIGNLCQHGEIDFQTHFTSNGYLLNNRIFDFLKGRNNSFQITLDGAKNYHDKIRFTRIGNGSFETIVRNIKRLAEIENHVLLRINYTKENAESVKDIVQSFHGMPVRHRKFVKIDFQRVWQDLRNKERVEETAEAINDAIVLFRNEGFHVSTHRVQNNAMYPCYGDKRNYVLINYNGDVYNCTARDFTKQNRTGHLNKKGIIEWSIDIDGRYAKKFSKPICHRCRIAPICGGGCIQKTIEQEQNPNCPFGYTEKDIDQMILDRFEFFFIKPVKE